MFNEYKFAGLKQLAIYTVTVKINKAIFFYKAKSGTNL